MEKIIIRQYLEKIQEEKEMLIGATNQIKNILAELNDIGFTFTIPNIVSVLKTWSRSGFNSVIPEIVVIIKGIQKQGVADKTHIEIDGIRINKIKFLELMDVPDVTKVAQAFREINVDNSDIDLIRKYISIADGNVILADNYLNEITLKHTFYAETETEKKRFDILNGVAQAYNKFLDYSAFDNIRGFDFYGLDYQRNGARYEYVVNPYAVKNTSSI